MTPRVRAGAVGTATALATLALALAAPSAVASAAPPTYADTTSVGVHNTYEKSSFPHLADALDTGTALIELDLWTNGGGQGWRVAHQDPFGNDNNCGGAESADTLRTGPLNTGFAGCLADLRAWHDANPGHRPIVVKVEMKDGFTAACVPELDPLSSSCARGPAQFDAMVDGKLGAAVLRPADVIGDSGLPLDEAVRQNGWPTVDEMAGKFVFELIPGTIEELNPINDGWTDKRYATHLRDLAAAGALRTGVAFTAVHGAQGGDPRIARYHASLRPWFVIFDGDAEDYGPGGVDGQWYSDNNYLLVMTSAQSVWPKIDGANPREAEARQRVELLAGRSASVVTADWTRLPEVLSTVVPRG